MAPAQRAGPRRVLAEGSAGGEIVLTLQPTGAVAGKVTSKQSLRGYSVQTLGAHGLGSRKADPELVAE